VTGIKKALICPMDWGIGHATRCVPVIEKLKDLGFELIIAASGRPMEFLKKEYPWIPVVSFPGIKIRYPGDNWFTIKVLLLAPKLMIATWREHQALKKIVLQTNASVVISDNRYGCWLPSIPSVFITHELEIQVPSGNPIIKRIINRINRKLINRFTECWVPDFEPHHGLAGYLSHPSILPERIHYIGILSRFSTSTDILPEISVQSYDLLVMLSGPEPQRTLIEEKILMQLMSINIQVALVRGITESDEAYVLDGRIHMFSHLETSKLKALIAASDLVIARSGYSTIMDIVTLGKRAIFIPTPGQSEQEYLAHYLMDKKIYFAISQENFDLFYAIEMSKNFPGMVLRNDYEVLSERINALKIIS